jgi:hypothetical protein
LDVAIKTLESIKRRDDLVYEFHKIIGQPKVVKGKLIESYLIRKKDAEHCTKLLRWILQQVPLIELELKPAKVADNDSIQGSIGVQRRSKRNRADESNEDRVSKWQRQDGEILDHRTRASTAREREREHRLKSSRHDLLNEGQASKPPKRNGQNYSLSPHEISDAADPTSIGEPLSIQTPIRQDSGASTARSAKARSIRHSAPRKARSTTAAKVVLDRKARVMKRGRGSGKSSNLSTLGSTLRRSTWMRKPPNRFQ